MQILPPETAPATTDLGRASASAFEAHVGTTAAPRAVRFRSEQLLADCENICETMGISERDLNFGVIPISHSYGFSNLLTPLIVRGVSLVLSNDRIPRAIIDGLAATRATVFPGMPVFYQSFCEMDRGTLFTGFAALHFRRSPIGPGNSASLLRKIRPRDPLFLRCIGVRWDLLCPRSTAGSGICWRGDVRS